MLFRAMNPALPPLLADALDALLEGVSRKDLALRAEKMSAAYRAGAASHGIADAADAIAYAVARMPATHAAAVAVFARLAEAWPGFAPHSLLDVGAGTGAAAWAAAGQWPGLRVTMLDRNPALRDLARRLAAAGPLAEAEFLAGDVAGEKPDADLVAASYVLAEFPERRAAAIATDLWRGAGQALVLIEPGTPAGFARIRLARAALIEAGGHVAAPCTHDGSCPLAASDWCHFSQRLPRSRAHMRLKDARVPFEDERYCYVAVTRQKAAQGARILAPPQETRAGLTFRLCDGTGLRTAFVPRREKEPYRRARRLGWGDLF
jgi:ribosomal protein RSM22 (predicted rRNA methylase)